MEKRTKTVTTILDDIVRTMRVVFESKEELVNNNIDDIPDWEQCKKEMNKFSDEEQDKIRDIMKQEEKLKHRKNQVKSALKNLEGQRENPEKRPNMKMKLVDKDLQK